MYGGGQYPNFEIPVRRQLSLTHQAANNNIHLASRLVKLVIDVVCVDAGCCPVVLVNIHFILRL